MKKIIFLLLFLPVSATAGEREVVEAHCQGRTEVIQADRTRVDCIEGNYAWEYDYASKWYNGFTQSLHYSHMTGLRPGLRLIFKKPSDMRFFEKAETLKYEWRLPIRLQIIEQY